MTSTLDYAVVIPTVGRDGLAELVRSADGEPSPTCIVVADDRPGPAAKLALPKTKAPLLVVRSGGRGPAAARNAGWRAAGAEWIAFLDDDVVLDDDWCVRLEADLWSLPSTVGACQGRLRVPMPAGARPTDEQRRTTGLVGAQWITADMAYRREALLATGGFDERFPRAFREDSDLALRTIRAGYEIVWGQRTTNHPPVSRGGWSSSIKAQAGNADNALLRAKYGPQWRQLIAAGPSRTGRHLTSVAAAGIALAAWSLGRRRLGAGAGAAWVGLTTEFAVGRILPGPRTAREIGTMALTSMVIPPVALFHRLRGAWQVRGVKDTAERPGLLVRRPQGA